MPPFEYKAIDERGRRTKGVLTADSEQGAYRDLSLGLDLLRPPSLFPNMTGRDVRMLWTLDGPYATARYSYLYRV